MKRLLILLALALGLAAPATTPAHAQVCGVNTVPQIGVICAVAGQPTYSATGVLMVPAASGTDIMCLNGSTTKTVSLRRVLVSGTAGTAITTPVLLNLNHSLDTGGTANTGLALPVAAPLNPANAAATATLTSYSANPTVNDTTPNLLWGQAVPFPVTTTATNPITEIKAGPGAVTLFSQSWDIPKAGTVVQQICVNLDGKTIATGLLNITFEWAEN